MIAANARSAHRGCRLFRVQLRGVDEDQVLANLGAGHFEHIGKRHRQRAAAQAGVPYVSVTTDDVVRAPDRLDVVLDLFYRIEKCRDELLDLRLAFDRFLIGETKDAIIRQVLSEGAGTFAVYGCKQRLDHISCTDG
jgi:hypothetical protein